MQVEARLFPAALNRPLRDPPHRRDFGEGEAAEEFQVDDFRERRLDGGELVERVADRLEPARVDRRVGDVRAQGGDLELAAAAHGVSGARVIDDQTAHHPRGVTHEARFVGKRRSVSRCHVEIRLVQQRRDSEAARSAGARELARRETVQLGVQVAEQRIGRHGRP